MLAFGGNLTAANVLRYITGNFDNVLIGRVLGAGPLGIYTKSYGLLMLPIGQISGPMGSALLPGLSRLQHNPGEYGRLFIRAFRTISFVTVPLVVFSFALAGDIVLVLLGRKWLGVGPVFQLLAPAALFGAISFAPGWLCQSLGRARRQLHYALVAAPVCVAGFLIGIKWGIAGVALSYSITVSLLFWFYVWYASKDSPVRFAEIVTCFLSALGPALAAALAAWVFRSYLPGNIVPFLALTVSGLIFCAIYLGAGMIVPKNRELILSGAISVRRMVKRYRRG